MPGVEICGEAATGREAVQLAKKIKPDLIVLDLSLPEINGVEVARTVRSTLPKTEVLVVTLHVSEDVARIALLAGARGYVAKSDPPEELIAAVKKVRKRKPHVTKRLARKLRRDIKRIQSLRSGDQAPAPDSTLSPEQITSILVRSEMKIREEAAAMLRRSRSESRPGKKTSRLKQ
jgi:two-component system response regulator NreC